MMGRMRTILVDGTDVDERTEKGSRESRGATLARGEYVDPDYVKATCQHVVRTMQSERITISQRRESLRRGRAVTRGRMC